MEVDKLYRTQRSNQTEVAGLLLKGTVSVTILGSQSKPAAIADMVDITEDGVAITEEGAYAFLLLPEYIYVNGTLDKLENVNFSVSDLGVLS